MNVSCITIVVTIKSENQTNQARNRQTWKSRNKGVSQTESQITRVLGARLWNWSTFWRGTTVQSDIFIHRGIKHIRQGWGSEASISNQWERKRMREIITITGWPINVDLKSHRQPFNTERLRLGVRGRIEQECRWGESAGIKANSKVQQEAELQNKAETGECVIVLINVMSRKLPNQSAN